MMTVKFLTSPLMMTVKFLTSPLMMFCSSGEFGSERLVQSVVDTILRQTAKKSDASPPPSPPPAEAASVSDEVTDTSWRCDMSSKTILTGQQVGHVSKDFCMCQH